MTRRRTLRRRYILSASAVLASTLLVTSSGLVAEEIAIEEIGSCPDASSICNAYTGGTCPLGAYYVGREALAQNFGSEYSIKPKDGNELFPTIWEVKHTGTLTGALIYQCRITPKNRHKSLLEIPAERHCAAALQTAEHYYLLFIASTPATDCVGWGECICY